MIQRDTDPNIDKEQRNIYLRLPKLVNKFRNAKW